MEWMLGLSNWIIQDGNYGEFANGDVFEAAVEFGFEELPQIGEPSTPRARLVRGSTHDLVGRILVIEPGAWVLDVGIAVFQESQPPPGFAVGDMILGRAYLGVDPFFYFERLGQRPSMPPLIYTWRVMEIARQTAPFIEAEPRVFVRDLSKLGWMTIERTDAWKDDGGNADYVLRCSLLAEPPRRARSG